MVPKGIVTSSKLPPLHFHYHSTSSPLLSNSPYLDVKKRWYFRQLAYNSIYRSNFDVTNQTLLPQSASTYTTLPIPIILPPSLTLPSSINQTTQAIILHANLPVHHPTLYIAPSRSRGSPNPTTHNENTNRHTNTTPR